MTRLIVTILALAVLPAGVPAAGQPATSVSPAAGTTAGGEGATGAPAQEDRPVVGPDKGRGPGAAGRGGDLWGVLQTLAALGVVLGLILLLRWGLGRLGRARTWLTGPAGVRILWRQNVGRHNQLLLVQLGERLMLVGAGQAGMTMLAEWHEPRQVQRILADLGWREKPSAAGQEGGKT